jgi:hypothetical protein
VLKDHGCGVRRTGSGLIIFMKPMERIGGGYRKIVQPACTGIEKKNSPLDKVSGYSFFKTLLCVYHAPGPQPFHIWQIGILL